ncbi:plastocyanin/azurin family copper-binding protein [Paraburkholderia strydomiana]|uniref:plastocyanin/azurin family copper-binding protein n=1 Tax=Paraburkholderia strydomiana TaxID=1245417 RepID=UPI001BE89B53
MAEPAVIQMVGPPDGSDVWFDPIGLWVRTGRAVRWVNRDAGNSHTATAYHPAVFGRSRRIPAHARPWNSDYLLPNGSFEVTFTEPGVYDYYCLPHEHAGMVGRIVVGDPNAKDWWQTPQLKVDSKLPAAALTAFPSIAEIIKRGYIHRAQ